MSACWEWCKNLKLSTGLTNMKQNRTHYTWGATPKAPTKKSNNCFNSVLTGFKPKQSVSIIALLALMALFAKLKDI